MPPNSGPVALDPRRFTDERGRRLTKSDAVLALGESGPYLYQRSGSTEIGRAKPAPVRESKPPREPTQADRAHQEKPPEPETPETKPPELQEQREQENANQVEAANKAPVEEPAVDPSQVDNAKQPSSQAPPEPPQPEPTQQQNATATTQDPDPVAAGARGRTDGFFESIFSGREEPGFGKSLVPIIGSVQNANYQFARGNVGWGIAYTALAVSDVFLVRSIVVGTGKLLARGSVELAGLGKTIVEELFKSGPGSKTSVWTKIRRLFLQDLKNYSITASAINRILKRHFKVSTAKGRQAMFEMHHWLIQHKWFEGANAISNQVLRDMLKAIGNANLNLIPLPSTINNALGKSMPATAALAQKVLATIKAEIDLVMDSFALLGDAQQPDR